MTQGMGKTQWSQDQAQQAAEIWQNLFVDVHGEDDIWHVSMTKARNRVLHQIADAIGRSFTSVEHRLQICGARFGGMQRSTSKISTQQINDMLARKEAENQMSFTSQFFGDPPPGYSALDKKRSSGARS